jgi:hypothetical protein
MTHSHHWLSVEGLAEAAPDAEAISPTQTTIAKMILAK